MGYLLRLPSIWPGLRAGPQGTSPTPGQGLRGPQAQPHTPAPHKRPGPNATLWGVAVTDRIGEGRVQRITGSGSGALFSGILSAGLRKAALDVTSLDVPVATAGSQVLRSHARGPLQRRSGEGISGMHTELCRGRFYSVWCRGSHETVTCKSHQRSDEMSGCRSCCPQDPTRTKRCQRCVHT